MTSTTYECKLSFKNLEKRVAKEKVMAGADLRKSMPVEFEITPLKRQGTLKKITEELLSISCDIVR